MTAINNKLLPLSREECLHTLQFIHDLFYNNVTESREHNMVNDKAQQALREYREKVANGEIIKENKTPKQKWEDDKKSLRKSINYFCVSCMGNERGVNNDIRNCTAKNCALYEVRPYQ